MNQRGAITVDFLFAFVLVGGLSLVIMTFSATLTMVEVAQYMTYAAARNFYSSNMTLERQQFAAQNKFQSLKKNPVVAPLLSGGWFEIPDDLFRADYNFPEQFPDFADYAQGKDSSVINLFHGVAITFHAHVLDFQIPFFGSTKKQDGAGDSFSTVITAFVGREPSFEECNNFNKDRWLKIKTLANANYSQADDAGKYFVINDNGC